MLSKTLVTDFVLHKLYITTTQAIVKINALLDLAMCKVF